MSCFLIQIEQNININIESVVCVDKLFELRWMDRIFRNSCIFRVYLHKGSHIVSLFIYQFTCFVSNIINIRSWHFVYDSHEMCAFAHDGAFSLKVYGFWYFLDLMFHLEHQPVYEWKSK